MNVSDEVQRVLDEIQNGAENGKTGIHGRKFLMAARKPQAPLAILNIHDKCCHKGKGHIRNAQNEAHGCERYAVLIGPVSSTATGSGSYVIQNYQSGQHMQSHLHTLDWKRGQSS